MVISMGIIKARKLVHEYIRRDEEGNVESIQTALNHVDIDVKAGQFIAVLGHNGSGKSTLVKTILGLNKNFTGSIIKEKKISVGYLPQQTLVQKDFPASVLEVVRSGTLS